MSRIIGKKAPNLHLEAIPGDGEDFFNVSLDTYKGHWLVPFFYPMDFIFVCPAEVITSSNGLYLLDEADAELLAISIDSEYTHQAWICNGLGRIGYPLGAGKTLSITADYGVLLEDQGVALRGLLIIDLDQAICYSVIHDNSIGRSAQEVLRVLKALQIGPLCSANWTIGSQPLKEDRLSLPDSFASDKMVRIYILPGCSYCHQVKEFLVDNRVSYEEIDLDDDIQGQAFMNGRGYTTLPAAMIGNHEISGFRLDKIKELLL